MSHVSHILGGAVRKIKDHEGGEMTPALADLICDVANTNEGEPGFDRDTFFRSAGLIPIGEE